MSEKGWYGGVYGTKDAGYLGGPEGVRKYQQEMQGEFKDTPVLVMKIEDRIAINTEHLEKSGPNKLTAWAEGAWPELGDIRCTLLEEAGEFWSLNKLVTMQVKERSSGEWILEFNGLQKNLCISQVFESRRVARFSGFMCWLEHREFRPMVLRSLWGCYAVAASGVILMGVGIAGLIGASNAAAGELWVIMIFISSLITGLGVGYGYSARQDLKKFEKYS